MNAFDWPKLMQAGMRGLRLRPREFWDLTPAELALLLGHGGDDAPLTRTGLDDLARAYPDETGGQ